MPSLGKRNYMTKENAFLFFQTGEYSRSLRMAGDNQMPKVPAFIKPVMKVPSQDKLMELSALARDAKLLENDIVKFEELLAKAKAEYHFLVTEKLPDTMDVIGVSKLEFTDPNSNQVIEITSKNFYHASISSEWDDSLRRKAFSYLDSIGEGDLIKTTIIISYAREDRAKALKILDQLRSKNIGAEIKESVHHATLTAWLKDQVENKNFVPDLNAIGAVVGRKVSIKEK